MVKTKPKPRRSREERRAVIESLRDRLEQWQGDVSPADVAAAVALFDGYSGRNACLIAMQRPDATDVRGYREWLSHGRQVRKGEKGIAILAPVARRADAEGDDDAERIGVKVAHVFDVEQTDPIDEQPSMLETHTEEN